MASFERPHRNHGLFSDYYPNTLLSGRTAIVRLERWLSLVDEAYGLTPCEVDLLWFTAPSRTPRLRG